MNHASQVLLAVATELSELAKASLPALREGETMQHEWFRDATFYRETNLSGQRFIAQFNFLERKVFVEGDNANAEIIC